MSGNMQSAGRAADLERMLAEVRASKAEATASLEALVKVEAALVEAVSGAAVLAPPRPAQVASAPPRIPLPEASVSEALRKYLPKSGTNRTLKSSDIVTDAALSYGRPVTRGEIFARVLEWFPREELAAFWPAGVEAALAVAVRRAVSRRMLARLGEDLFEPSSFKGGEKM